MGKGKTRITLDLTESQYNMLEELQSKSGASSKADVLRQSIRLLDFALTKHRSGYEFLIRRDNQDPILLPLFEIA